MNPKKSTFGLIFFTKKANENGECRIYSRITINGKSVDLSTKRVVNKILWNSAKGMARGTSKESLEINDYLEQFRSGIVDAYQEAIIQQKPLTPEHIRNAFLGRMKLTTPSRTCLPITMSTKARYLPKTP